MVPPADNVIWMDRPGRPGRREPPVPHAVFGMFLFVICESLFFAGLVAAFLVGQSVSPGAWPPPGEPRLPVLVSGLNTGVLLASGITLFLAGRSRARNASRFKGLLAASCALGGVFLGIQGSEWAALIREGLTLAYSQHASFFYLLIGTHAVHVVIALLVLLYALRQAMRGTLAPGAFAASQVFWYFVVAVWPILYVLVYLS